MFVDEQHFDWTEAHHHCATHEGAHLAVIDSAGEDLTLRDFARRLYKDHSSGATSFWIGATDDVTEGLWVWYTNRNLVSSGYNNWAPGQPQNFASYDQDCACLYGKSGFLWEDCGCSSQLHAICEKKFKS